MSKFYKGQIVRIDPTSGYYSPARPTGSNPSEVDGTVTNPKREREALTVEVQWSNGTYNTYREGDLFAPEAQIGDTVQVTGAGPDDHAYIAEHGTAYHVIREGIEGVVDGEGTRDTSMRVRFGMNTQFIPKAYFILTKRGVKAPTKPINQEVVMPIVAPKTPKLSYKTYKDSHGDTFKVDTEYNSELVSFEPSCDDEGNESPVVTLDVASVKRLRKQLKNWLDANGHND